MQLKINQAVQKQRQNFHALKPGALFRLAPEEKPIKGIKPDEAYFLKLASCDDEGNNAVLTHHGVLHEVGAAQLVIEYAVTGVEEV